VAANTALPTPDRPALNGISLATGTTSIVNHTHTADVENLAVRGSWNMTANPGAETTLAEITTNSDIVLADVRMKTDNRMTVRTRDADGTFKEYALRTGLTHPGVHGAELVVTGAGKAGGVITAYYISPSGAREPATYAVGANWASQLARKANTYSPAGAAIQSTNVTLSGSTYLAERDSQGNPLKQLYIFKHPFIQDRNIGVKAQVGTLLPGETYTVAWWMRWAFAGTVPNYPLRYYLKNRNGETIELGSIVGPDGATAEAAWADKYLVITPDLVPEGYNQLWLDTGTYEQGEFVMQHPLFAKGALTTQAARDNARYLGRLPQGVLTAIVPMGLPIKSPFDIGLGHHRLRHLFAEPTAPEDDQGNPMGSSSVRYATSAQDPPVSWSAWETEPEMLPEGLVGKIEVTLNTNGFDGPALEVGDLGYGFTHQQSTLCRIDQSPLPGGTLVNGLEDAIELPDYNSEPSLGHARNDPITDPIIRVEKPVEVVFFDAEAYIEFMENWAKKDWRFEAPNLGPYGKFMVFRPYEPPSRSDGQELVTQQRYTVGEELRRAVVARVTINRMEIVEYGELAWGEEKV
jgi:hypothetical protein